MNLHGRISHAAVQTQDFGAVLPGNHVFDDLNCIVIVAESTAPSVYAVLFQKQLPAVDERVLFHLGLSAGFASKVIARNIPA